MRKIEIIKPTRRGLLRAGAVGAAALIASPAIVRAQMGLMGAGGVRKSGGGGGGGGPTLTFVSTSSQGTAANDHSTDTHGPFSVGSSQAGNKLIIVPVYASCAFDLTGANGNVLCSGTTMVTPFSTGFAGNENSGVWYLEVAGGTTSVTITINNSSAGMKGSIIACYWASGYGSSTPGHHAENARAIVAPPATTSETITVDTGGFAVYVAVNDDSSLTGVFTGPVSMDGSIGPGTWGNGRAYFGHTTTSGTETHTVNTAGDNIADASASWA